MGRVNSKKASELVIIKNDIQSALTNLNHELHSELSSIYSLIQHVLANSYLRADVSLFQHCESASSQIQEALNKLNMVLMLTNTLSVEEEDSEDEHY